MILAILSFLVFAWFIAGYLGVSQNLRGASVFITLASILGALFLIPETNSFSIIMGGWAPWATISFIFCVTFFSDYLSIVLETNRTKVTQTRFKKQMSFQIMN